MDECGPECSLHRAGHVFHWVQWSASMNLPGSRHDAVVESVSGKACVVRMVDTGEVEILWHHRPLDDVLEPGQEILRSRAFAFITLGREVGTRFISVKPLASVDD